MPFKALKEGYNMELSLYHPKGQTLFFHFFHAKMLYWVIKNHPVEGIRAEISFSDRARSL